MEDNRDNRAVLRYLHEVDAAIDRISKPEKVLYQAVAGHPGVFRYLLNRTTALYYRVRNGNVELITFFDSRQHPDALGL